MSQAKRQAVALLVRRLPGARGTTVKAHLARAAAMAACVYRRWQVGPYQWQVKHLRWYLERATAGLATGVRYRYWLTTRLLVIALGAEGDWLPRLKGPWERPTESVTPHPRSGRPLKRPT